MRRERKIRPTITPDLMLKGWSRAVNTSSFWKYQSMQIKAIISKRERLKDARRPTHPIPHAHPVLKALELTRIQVSRVAAFGWLELCSGLLSNSPILARSDVL